MRNTSVRGQLGAMTAAVLMMILVPVLAFAESTISQVITRPQFDANGQVYYFAGAAKWGAPSCPNAEYAFFRSSLLGHKELFAMLLAAYHAGKTVQFAGNCQSDNYFEVSYVWVE